MYGERNTPTTTLRPKANQLDPRFLMMSRFAIALGPNSADSAGSEGSTSEPSPAVRQAFSSFWAPRPILPTRALAWSDENSGSLLETGSWLYRILPSAVCICPPQANKEPSFPLRGSGPGFDPARRGADF